MPQGNRYGVFPEPADCDIDEREISDHHSSVSGHQPLPVIISFPQIPLNIDVITMVEPTIERTDLGRVKTRYRPGTENIVAGGILGMLFTGGGIALGTHAIRQVIAYGGKLPFQAPGQIDWMQIGMLGFFGVVAILFGAGAFFLVRTQLLSFSVTVCANGFYCTNQGERTDYPWESIASIDETITRTRMRMLKAAKYALPERVSHSYTVHRSDGKAVDFYEDNVKQLPELISLFRQELGSRNVPWSVKEERA